MPVSLIQVGRLKAKVATGAVLLVLAFATTGAEAQTTTRRSYDATGREVGHAELAQSPHKSKNGQLAKRMTNMSQNLVAMKPHWKQHNATRKLLPKLKTIYIVRREVCATKWGWPFLSL